ncbi:hypothetical protein PR002_g19090 [Phytophthora rubi]|uniref:Ubiquitin-like domain-containing protein n=1 Tax=Phytophthora rubi TaxID=129364 RepID=A0A6A3JPP0_9STRA|nr:hypothetical protein PR002_g19090 [Phytophthora rubi]
MLPTALPVLWKDGDRSGINGVVQVHQSDLQFRDAKIRDLVAVLNTKIPKPSGSSRAVQSVLLYGARLSSDRRLDAIVPDLAGSSPRLMATMGSPPSTTLDVVIVVDTLTGKMTRVPFNPKVSVADVKQRLQDMEGIPQNDQIFVVNNARLEDNRALESYNIHNGSLIYLVWKLKRGYISPRSVGGGLDDVVQANHETTAASRWRIAYEGLNVEGRCTNEYCAAFQRMVIRPYQFESFNLVREGSILCPVCHCPVKPLTCGFLNCAWKFDGIRAGNGLSISSPWRDASGTSFTDTQDKRLVVLALEYESQSKRVVWKEVARAMRGLYAYRAYRSSVFRDEFRMDRYGQLYHSEQIISGTEDTNSNFARDISKEISRLGPGHIVKLADGSMGLRGFLVFNTMGGGMGFRHGALFLERLSVDFDGSTTTAKIWDEG